MKITFRYNDTVAKDYKIATFFGNFDTSTQVFNLSMSKEYLESIPEICSRLGIECNVDMELDINPEETNDTQPQEVPYPKPSNFMTQSFDLAADIHCYESVDDNSVFYVDSITKTETHSIVTINESTFKFFLEDTPTITFAYKSNDDIHRIYTKIVEDKEKANQFHIAKSSFLMLTENNK